MMMTETSHMTLIQRRHAPVVWPDNPVRNTSTTQDFQLSLTLRGQDKVLRTGVCQLWIRVIWEFLASLWFNKTKHSCLTINDFTQPLTMSGKKVFVLSSIFSEKQPGNVWILQGNVHWWAQLYLTRRLWAEMKSSFQSWWNHKGRFHPLHLHSPLASSLCVTGSGHTSFWNHWNQSELLDFTTGTSHNDPHVRKKEH